MNIETDNRNIESEKTIYGVSKAMDYEERPDYFNSSAIPIHENNRKTARLPNLDNYETNYIQQIAPIESFDEEKNISQSESSHNVVLILLLLIIFVCIFYISKKCIYVEERTIEMLNQ